MQWVGSCVLRVITCAGSCALRAQRLKKFNLDWKFQSRLKIPISIENFNPDLQNSPQKIGVCWVSRLKFSISIEIFNPGGRSWIFSIFGPFGCSWLITSVGHVWGHPSDNVATQSGKVPYVQNSLLDKVSVAGRGGSSLKADYWTLYQDKASAEIRGEFFRTNSQVNFAGDFLWIFWGLFGGKTGGKKPPQNSQRNSNQNLGASRPKSPLQESGVDSLSLSIYIYIYMESFRTLCGLFHWVHA